MAEDLNSFLSAVDNHNIANGDESWLSKRMGDLSDFALDLPEHIYKGGTGVVVAGVNSILNSGVAVANLVGADIEPISTYNTLKALDDDLGEYYKKHQGGIEIGGFVAGMFVPGMAGVKAFQAAKAGFLGTNMAKSSGLLTSLTRDYATAAKLEFATGSSPFTLLNSNVLKALGQGVGANALEAGAFELAVAGTMFKSPVLEEQSAGNMIHNMLTGIVLGGGIGGVLHGVGTYYKINKGIQNVKADLFPYSHITELEELAPHDLKIISYFQQKLNIPEPAVPSGGFKELDPASGLTLMAKEADKTRERLDVLIRQEFNHFTSGDEKIGNQLYEKFKDQTNLTEIVAGLIGSKSAQRITENEKLVVGDVLFPTHGIDKQAFRDILARGTSNELLVDTATAGTKGFKVIGDISKLKVTGVGELIGAGIRVGNREVAYEQGYDLFRNSNGTFSVNPKSSILAATENRRTPNNLVVDFEQGGTIVDKATPGLADLATKANAIEVRGDTVLAGDINPLRVGNWKFDPLDDDYLKVQARYIWAQEQKGLKFKDKILEHNDFPMLEQAYFQNGKEFRIRQENGNIVAGPTGERLKDYIYKKKVEYVTKLDGKPIDELELRLNISRQWLHGEPAEIAKLKPGVDYNNPRYARIDYPDNVNAMEAYNAAYVDGAIQYEFAVQQIKQRHTQTFVNYAGRSGVTFPEALNFSDPGRTPTGAATGASLAGFANANYGSVGGWAQFVGSLTNRLKVFMKTETVEAMNNAAARINTEALRSELDLVVNKLRSSPEAWVFHPENPNVLILRKEFRQVTKGAEPSETIKMSGASRQAQKTDSEFHTIDVSNEQGPVAAFLRTHAGITSGRQVHIDNMKAAAGVMNDSDLAVVYAPPIDTTRYKHFAFVEPKTFASLGDRKRVIVAKDESTLSSLIDQVDQNEFRVYTKQESEEWHKAIGDYDFQLGLNESAVDSSLKRKGILSDHFAGNPSPRILDDFLNWHIRQEEGLATRMVEHRYSQSFQELQHLGDRYTNIATSQFRSLTEALVERVKDPYQDVVKTALDISRASEYQWWRSFNDLVRDTLEKPGHVLGDLWKDVVQKGRKIDDTFVQEVNAKSAQLGLGQPFSVAAMELVQKNIADKPFLARWIGKAQSIMSTTLLQLDFFNAVNNIVSTPVLLGAEAKYLLNGIAKSDPLVAGKLAALTSVGVPGQVQIQQFSLQRLLKNAVENYRKDDMEGLGLLKRYQQIGAVTDILQQERQMLGNLTLDFGKVTSQEVDSKFDKALEFGKKWTGNKMAEEMTRFVAADVMRQITDLALEAKVLRNVGEADEYIQLFVNKVQGNYLHSQRPIVFQGVVGQAVSLFQTYQFNLMQQLFKYVGEGDKKSIAMLLGLQSSIYGMQGLPAFNFVNTHIVGNAAGNTEHRDLYFAGNSVFGKSLGDWILYGAGANALGIVDPSLKINLYSRGDINPRSMTVLPSNIEDIPVVNASIRFVGNLWQAFGKVTNGAQMLPTISQAIEHNGLSRPLAGLAQVVQGYTTTNQGSLLSGSQDFWNIATLSRIGGGKPFDEAIALDALFRINAYRAKDLSRIQDLGSAFKTQLVKGQEPDEQTVVQFASAYAKSGGRIENFQKFMVSAMTNANKSQVNRVVEHLNSPFAQQLQVVMGGQELPDFLNQPAPTTK